MTSSNSQAQIDHLKSMIDDFKEKVKDDKLRLEAVVIESLQPYGEELTRTQIQMIADSIVRKMYLRN